MKNYIDIEKKEEVKRIINSIIDDNETWAQGIPRIDSELQEKGFTSKEAGQIEWMVIQVINRICKKI